MGTPDMGMVIRAGKLWTTWGKIEACMTRKETPERSHQRIHAAGSGVTLLSCLPLGLSLCGKSPANAPPATIFPQIGPEPFPTAR